MDEDFISPEYYDSCECLDCSCDCCEEYSSLKEDYDRLYAKLGREELLLDRTHDEIAGAIRKFAQENKIPEFSRFMIINLPYLKQIRKTIGGYTE